MTILKAVVVTGRLWAKITTRFIKHRNPGHLHRKYQVLERRIKSAIKEEISCFVKLLDKSSNIKPDAKKNNLQTKANFTEILRHLVLKARYEPVSLEHIQIIHSK